MADITQILRDLAAGRIDAAEADRLIGAATAGEQMPPPADSGRAAGDEEPPASLAPRQGTTVAPQGVERVQVRTVGLRVRILGDPGVAAVSAEGPHTLRRAGTTLEVSSEGELGPALDAFTMLRAPRSLDDLWALGRTGLGSIGLGRELLLRINPALEVDIEMTAGSLSVHGLPRLAKVRVTAGGASLHDVAELSDALLQAGSLSLHARLVGGRSRVRVESGQLSVELDPESSVTVRADAQMGRVSWPDDIPGVDEYVLGDGLARLDVGVVMGYASVRVATGHEDQPDHGHHGTDRPGRPAGDDAAAEDRAGEDGDEGADEEER